MYYQGSKKTGISLLSAFKPCLCGVFPVHHTLNTIDTIKHDGFENDVFCVIINCFFLPNNPCIAGVFLGVAASTFPILKLWRRLILHHIFFPHADLHSFCRHFISKRQINHKNSLLLPSTSCSSSLTRRNAEPSHNVVSVATQNIHHH